jgi:hypothetical protein
MQNELATVFLTGTASEHVCTLHGFYNTDNELWYDLPPPAADINALLSSRFLLTCYKHQQ